MEEIPDSVRRLPKCMWQVVLEVRKAIALAIVKGSSWKKAKRELAKTNGGRLLFANDLPRVNEELPPKTV